MKMITNPKEFAPIINFHKMPVIEIDLADADEYGIISKPVNIDFGFFENGEPFYERAVVRAYADEKRFTFSVGGCCIHSGFGYYDMEKMLQYANAPVIHTDEDVLITIVDSRTKTVLAPIVMHTAKRVNKFCTTPLTFTDSDNDASGYLRVAGVKECGA